MWRTKFRTEFVVWSFLLLCSVIGQTSSQQLQRPPAFFGGPPAFSQVPQFQPQAVLTQQPRTGNDPSAVVAAAPTAATPATAPLPAGTTVQFQQPQPQLDAFIPQLDPFIPKPVLFQLSTNIFNSAGIKVSHFSRFQIWYLTSQILKSVDDRLKPDYITMLQPQLVKGIPSQNLTQALSQPHHPEILKTLVEQSTGMLTSQQAIVVQKIRSRLSEPMVIRMIMESENPAELFGYFNPMLLARNMASIIKTIGEMPETILSGTNIQAKLLPRVTLSTWLATARKLGKVERWSADDLVGKSFFGLSNHLDLALMGLGCNDLELVSEQDILVVIGRYRHELYELRKRVQLQLPFPLNIRNCAMERVLEYLKQKNGTAADVNILSGLRIAEIDMIGGEILSGIPAPALDNVPSETRQAILEEIGQVDSIDLFNLLSMPTWFGNKLYNDLVNSSQSLSQTIIPPQPQPMPLANNLHIPLKMGNLLFYSNDFLTGNWSKEVITDILASRTGSYCLPKKLRLKWAELLLATFGPISSWTPNDLASIGDLLVVLSPSDLNTIPVETLARGVTTILRQSGFHSTVGSGSSSFIRKCIDSLDDGQDFYMSFKLFMRKLLQATQLMVNSVRTIDEVVLNEISRGPTRVARSIDGPEPRRQADRVRRQASAAIAALRASTNANSTASSGSLSAPATLTPIDQTQTPPPFVVGLAQTNPQPQLLQQQQTLPTPGNPRLQQFPPPRVATAPPQDFRFAPRPTSFVAPQQQTPQMQNQASAQTQAQSQATSSQTLPPLVSRATTTASTASAPSGPMPSAQTPDNFQPQAATGAQSQAVSQTGAQPAQIQMSTPQIQAPLPSSAAASAPDPASATQQQQSTGGLSGRAVGAAPAPQFTPGAIMMPQQPQTQATASASSPMAAQTGNIQATPAQAQAQAPAQMGSQQQQLQQSQFQTQAASPQQSQSQTFDARALRPNQNQQQQPPIGFQQQQFQRQLQPPRGPFPQQLQQQQPQPPLIPVVPRPLNQTDNTTATATATTAKTDDERSVNTTDQGVPVDLKTNNATAVDLQGRSLDANTTKLDDRKSSAAATPLDLPKDSVDIPITCRGMKAAGPAAIGMTLTDFNQLSTADLFECVEPIGLIDWDMDMKKMLLALMSEKLHLTPERVNILSLIELGGLVSGFGVADNADGSWLASGTNSTTMFDISAIDLTLPDNIDGLSILGTQIEDPEVLKTLADKFTLQNQITGKIRGAISRPDNLRVVIWSLGNLICGMDEQIIAGIFDADRSLFIDVSPMLGRVVGCPITMLQTFAESAVMPSNYGDPVAWTEQDMEVIGVVVAGLKPSQLATIPPASFAGLTPAAVQQLSTTAFRTLTPSQVARIPYESALAIQAHHLEVLSQDQMNALNGVISVQSEHFNVPDIVLRGSGDSDFADGVGDLEMVRSLNDTGPGAANETIAGRSGPENSTARKVNGSTSTPLGDPSLDDDDLVEIVVVDDDGSTSNASGDATPKTNRTRRPVKEKETSRPSSSPPSTTNLFTSALSYASIPLILSLALN